MKFIIAVLALIGADARIRLSHRNYVGVTFVNGVDDMDLEAQAARTSKILEEQESASPGVRFVNSMPSSNPGVRFVQSDPIKGSLGWPKPAMEDLGPEARFEESQRLTPPPKFEDDADVTTTLNSIKIAEELAGGKFPDPESEKEKEKVKPTPNYHLADSDEEEDDTGDSTVETRRSIKYAENELKQRWFINNQERRTFNKKVNAGAIRPEVLDFKDKSDADPQATVGEVAEKEASKKKKAVAEVEEKEAQKAEDK